MALLRAIELELGTVPGVFRLLACDAGALQAVWAPLAGALFVSGHVPRTTKELGALAAVSVGRVPAFRELFRQALARRGLQPEVLDDLVRDGASSRLPERTQEVIAFLCRATLQPARVSAADYTALRRRGLREVELAELVAAAGAVGLLIATARALGEAEG